ncbi:MAG: hypothetical protein HOP18_11400 [Deltaproteobacteria bacterium]|nr:hypothetical protein [Deltaproteobacteria bacterium]
MTHLTPLVVTEELLNPVGTLAAPRMLAAAYRAVRAALRDSGLSEMTLVGYTAEFKEGAREGDTVNVALAEVTGLWPGDHAFQVLFSKGGDTTGRVGKWLMTFAEKHETRPLPYDITHALADGLTDRELWQAEPIVATGDEERDVQRILWPIGQSARAYMKQLDLAFATHPGVTCVDEVPQRIYAGIAVTVHLSRWPSKDQEIRCALHLQRPLQDQPKSKRMEFPGVLVSQEGSGTSLLGTCRFTVSRLSCNRVPVYGDGTKEPRGKEN